METIKDVILNLKEVRKEKNLSFDQILVLMEQNGQYLSKSTLSRIFAENSENTGSFRYETLRPIADILLDINHDEKEDNTDVLAMKSILRFKKELIEELSNKLATSGEEAEQQINEIKASYAEKLEQETKHFGDSLAFLSRQIQLKDERIDMLLAMNNELMATNNRLVSQLMECPLREKE